MDGDMQMVDGNAMTSKLEEEVRAAVIAAGYTVPATKQAIHCPRPDAPGRTAALTPDIALPDHKVAVEVDPLGSGDHNRAFTHIGEEATDLLRNELFAAAGWTVIRLRLGGTHNDALGPYDVVAEATQFSTATRTELLAAIDDAVHNRTTKVRLVKKRPPSKTAERRTPVVNIGPDKYADDALWFSWYPDLTGPKVAMRLSVAGRYLYTYDRDYIAELGLHELPEDQWRDVLVAYLADKNPDQLGTTRWPWGDSLLVPGDDEDDTVDLIERIDYKTKKEGIDTTVIEQTVNCARLARYTTIAFATADDATIAELHPAACELGYRIVDVKSHKGRHGLYQIVLIARPPRLDLTKLEQ